MLSDVDVRLYDGPHDGTTANCVVPLPQLVAIRYCPSCRAAHVCNALAPEHPGEAVYLRYPELDHDGQLAYVFVDVADTLERIAEFEHAVDVLSRWP